MTRAPIPVHESLEADFAAAIPPRPVPVGRRAALWVLLTLLAFPPSRALLLWLIAARRR